MLTFKCLKDLALKYLNELLKVRKASCFTRSVNDELLLEVGKTGLVTPDDRSFLNVTPNLWNTLPYSLKACDTVETFNTNLKAYLFKQYFIK